MSAAENEGAAATPATVWPIAVAVGVAVLLVGLIVNPLVIAPLGAAITALAGLGWIRVGRPYRRSASGETTPAAVASRSDERYSRSRFLGRATLGVGGLVGAGVALPATALTILGPFVGQRRRPSIWDRSARFPKAVS